MKLSWLKYLVLLAVFICSIVLMWALQSNGTLHVLMAMPAFLALVGALYQLVRDEAAHVKQLAIQHDQQRFTLGVTSHMADVAFDKHAAFCEEYVAELYVTLRTLYREGESPAALTHADNLLMIIRKHSVWLTSDIERQLEPFDRALRRLGAAAWLQRRNPGAALVGGRVAEMYDIFADILGLQKDPDQVVNGDIAITAIVDKAREVLGVRQLIALRQRLLGLRQFSDRPLLGHETAP